MRMGAHASVDARNSSSSSSSHAPHDVHGEALIDGEAGAACLDGAVIVVLAAVDEASVGLVVRTSDGSLCGVGVVEALHVGRAERVTEDCASTEPHGDTGDREMS